MNEVLKASLLKKQLPAYVNDVLGNTDFGPSLKTQSHGEVTVGGKEFSIDELMARCSDDAEIKKIMSELVNAISKASPHNIYRFKNAGLLGRIWNRLTGGIDTKVIEFNLYCRRVEKLSKLAPAMLVQLQDSILLIHGLRDLYHRDVELLDQYIEAGHAYLDDVGLSSGVPEYGLTRLRRKLVNLKVAKSTLEMQAVSVGISLTASLENQERMNDCLNGLLPMWQRQISMFKSGVYDINIDTDTDEKFRALVKKLNASTDKGKGK